MQSKISYFKGIGKRIANAGVWRKDIVSFWPLWTIEFLLLQMITTLPLRNRIHIIWQEYGREQGVLEVCRLFHVSVSTGSYVILIAPLAILVAVFVFGYLNHSRSAYMLHSLPVSRGTYFMTHFLSGLAMLFAPFAATYGILWGISLWHHLGMGAVVLGNLLTTFLVILFFYSLACVVVMLSGNGIMSLVIYGVLNVLEIGFCKLLGAVTEQFAYSYTFDLKAGLLDSICTPILGFVMLFKSKEGNLRVSSRGLPGMMGDSIWGDYFSAFYEEAGKRPELMEELAAVDWKSIGFCLLSVVVSGIFLFAAFKLYQRRPLERVGDLMAFRWCKPVFRAVFCACGSLLCANIFTILFSGRMANIPYGNQRFACAFFVLFGCLISYVTGDMILAKSFSIWKRLSWVQIGVFCTAMLVIVMGANYFFGYQGQLSTEALGKSDYISVRIGSASFLYPKEEYERLGLEEIRRDIVRDGQELTPADAGKAVGYSVDTDITVFVKYEYIMSTGENRRTDYSYHVNKEKQEALLDSLKEAVSNADNMAAAVFTKAYEAMECRRIEVQKIPGDAPMYEIEGDARDRVFQAFLKDLKEGRVPVENWAMDDFLEDHRFDLYFQTVIAEKEFMQAGVPEELWWEFGSHAFDVAVTEEMENTWRELQGLKKTDLNKDFDRGVEEEVIQ